MYQRHQAYNNGTSKTEVILRGQMSSGHGIVLLCNVEIENEGREGGDLNNTHTIFPCSNPKIFLFCCLASLPPLLPVLPLPHCHTFIFFIQCESEK